MKQQSERLGKEPIPKLLSKLAFPAMIGMFVMASYNVVDTIIISKAVGTLGVAAVSIAFPVQMIMMALAGAIGIGGASVISRMLGANKLATANQVFGNVISLVLIISIIGLLLGLSLLTPILILFGSSPTILPLAQDYLGIILYGTVFFAFGFSMNNIVRSEGNARTAMMTMVISAALNVVFTMFLVFVMNLGIKGSALGTVLAQAVTACYLIIYFIRGRSSLSFKPLYLIPRLFIIKQISAIGSSAFIQQAAGSVMFIVANHMLVFYGGDLAVAVFGIIHKVLMFSLMPIVGVVQGLLPIVGYNFGANLHHRVSESILLAIKASTIIATTAFVSVMAFPRILMLVFTDDILAVEMGITALRIIFALSMTIGLQIITGGVFQALGKARAAFILSMSRQIFFLIPMLLAFPLIFGLSGVWLAFPLSDLLSFFLSLWYIQKHKSIFFIGKQSVASSLN
ncbi:MAG: MATE family efflux transporter [Gracilibacter sp. BRH_c7a]|nr:MAG: MATE family efflux transporter [Gracilibacter sp. BRH_c7a]